MHGAGVMYVIGHECDASLICVRQLTHVSEASYSCPNDMRLVPRHECDAS